MRPGRQHSLVSSCVVVLQYSGRELGGFEPGIDAQVAQFVSLIERKYISTPADYRPIEFAHKAQYFALDVISALGYGHPIGFLENDTDMHRYIEINDESFKIFALMSNMPWLAAMMQRWPLNMALPKDSDPIGFGRLLRYGGPVPELVDVPFSCSLLTGRALLLWLTSVWSRVPPRART